jgi:hypothetical protein
MSRVQVMAEYRDSVEALGKIGRRSKPATPAETVSKAPAVFPAEISS